MTNRVPCQIQTVERVAQDIFCITLKLSVGNFNYRPGQYINLALPDSKPRSFSIAGGQSDGRTIELHIRDSGSGFVNRVLSARDEPDSLCLVGPYGDFYYREKSMRDDQPVILMASGTGFSSIKAILEQLSRSGVSNPIHLFWGGRCKSDLYLLHWVEALTRSMKQLTFIPVLSEPKPQDDWTGRVGNVHEIVMEDFPDMSDCNVYACGAPVVIESARRDFSLTCELPGENFFA